MIRAALNFGRYNRPHAMLGRYLIFCIGAALLQAAFVKQPDALDIRFGRVGHSPEAFANSGVRFAVMGLAIISLVIEAAVGLALFGWWPGLFVWMPALVVVGVLVPARNPAPPVFIGLVVAVGAGVSLLF